MQCVLYAEEELEEMQRKLEKARARVRRRDQQLQEIRDSIDVVTKDMTEQGQRLKDFVVRHEKALIKKDLEFEQRLKALQQENEGLRAIYSALHKECDELKEERRMFVRFAMAPCKSCESVASSSTAGKDSETASRDE